MKKLLFFSVIMIPFMLKAQSESSIDISFGVNNSFRTLNNTGDTEFINSIYELRQETEEKYVTLSFGIHYNKMITNNWHLRTGFRYTELGFEATVGNGLMWPSQHNGAGGFNPNLPSLEPQFGGMSANYSFLDVPIFLRKTFINKTWSPFFEFGIVPSYLIQPSIEEVGFNFNKFQLAGILSGGVNYTMKSFQVFFQPAFRYHITNTVKNATIKEHLYSGGLEIGIRKLLNPKNDH